MLREQIIPAIQEIADRNLDDIFSSRIKLLFITVLMYVNIWMKSFLIGGG